MQLSDINIKCQLQIMDKLDLNGLLNVAQTSAHFETLAADIFRRKHAKKTVEIFGPLKKEAANPIEESSVDVRIENYQTVLKFIRVFGPLIQKLTISYPNIELHERKEIHELVDKYCSDTLLTIFLNSCDQNALQNLKKPFKMVEEVIITGELETSQHSTVKLNEIFPSLRRLSLNYIETLDTDIVDVEFPHLNHFSVTFTFLMDIKIGVEKLFKKNRHLKNLTLSYCNSFDYLKMASEYLPKLEGLWLDWENEKDEYEGSRIEFAGLKKLRINWGRYTFWEIATPDQLEELEIECSAEECVKFAVENRRLKKLSIVQPSLNDNDIAEIADKLPDLVDVFIFTDTEVSTNNIIKFIEGSENLRRLNLQLPSETAFDEIKNHFKEGWKFTGEYIDFTLERLD